MLFITLFFLFIPKTLAYTTVDLTLEEDTYIEEKYPTISPWNTRNLFLGTDTWYTKGKNRILIKPDFSKLQLQDIIPSDIEKVELELSAYLYEGTEQGATIDSYTTTSPWSMFDVTWSTQPSITSKKDSTIITTSEGRKKITITAAFLDAFKNYPIYDRGILLKINPETDKSLVFWAHGCDVAPSPPICESPLYRPSLKIILKENTPPTFCKFKTPSSTNLITNNPTILLEVLPSVDAESDVLSYSGRVCRDLLCYEKIWQNQMAIGSKSSVELADGTYYAQCTANDGHKIEQWGDSSTIVVDTIPPAIPMIVPEPPFTGSSANKIFWYPYSEQDIFYQLLASERADFRSYNKYSPWISENFIEIQHDKEKQYYYKIKARDRAGNESDWSESTSTVIDHSVPMIKYFKSNKLIFSPTFSKNNEPTNSAYIQGGVEDQTIKKLTLDIRNQQQKIIYAESILDKTYLWTHWPDKPLYADGIYFAQLSGEDEVGNLIQSDILQLVIDTTPPSSPKFVGISNGQIINKTNIRFQTVCPMASFATVYLGGKIISSNQRAPIISVSQKEGLHTVSANCSDLVGNKAMSSIQFTVDTISPAPPPISYSFDDKTLYLQLKVFCREKGLATLYRQGIYLSSAKCDRNKYFIYKVPRKINLPYFATFTASLSDSAGNKSALSEKVIFLEKQDQQQIKKTQCQATYNYEKKLFSNIACDWQKSALAYESTKRDSSTTFSSTFRVPAKNDTVVVVTVLSCKQVSLWDPRTWVTCILETTQEITVSAKLTPLFKSEHELVANSNTQIVLTHPEVSTITISYSYLLQFSARIGDKMVYAEKLSERKELFFALNYSDAINMRYFSWIFKSPKEVTQWYGNTEYQKPHTGIDFAVSKETILSPEKGVIVASSYHKKDACFAGGNYIGIKHTNGMYTYYFHLESRQYPNGNAIRVGDIVQRKQQLTKTGSSGMYNCEPLSAHLHFEVRKSNSSITHTNPTYYFDINWNLIKTARSNIFKGRLTGENPHPKF